MHCAKNRPLWLVHRLASPLWGEQMSVVLRHRRRRLLAALCAMPPLAGVGHESPPDPGYLHGDTATIMGALAMPPADSLRVAVARDCMFFAVVKLRHGVPQNPGCLMTSRLKEMVRRYTALRKAVIRPTVRS